MWPFRAAWCNAVLPPRSETLTLLSMGMITSAHFTALFAAATCNGVCQFLSRALTSAECLISTCTASYNSNSYSYKQAVPINMQLTAQWCYLCILVMHPRHAQEDTKGATLIQAIAMVTDMVPLIQMPEHTSPLLSFKAMSTATIFQFDFRTYKIVHADSPTCLAN